MANIRLRGNSYQIRVFIGEDDVGQKKYKTKTWRIPSGMSKREAEKQAQREADKFENLIFRGMNVDKITFKKLSLMYIEDIRKLQKPKSVQSHEEHLKRINEAFGHIEVSKLTKQHIRDFISDLEKPYYTRNGIEKKLSATTIRDYFRTISVVMTYACEMDYISDNPCIGKGIRLPEVKEKEDKMIAPEVLGKYMRLMDEAPIHQKAFFYLALYTGARRGELLGLKWDDVDFKNNTISINESAGIIDGKGVVFTSPKTKSSERVLQIPEDVMKMLKHLSLVEKEKKLQVGYMWKRNPDNTSEVYCENHDKCDTGCTGYCAKLCKMFNNSERVFTQANGVPMNPRTPGQYISKLGKKNDLPSIKIHGLRHTAVSILIHEGNSIPEIAHYVGHANPSVTTRIYSHAIKEREDAAKLGNSIAGFLDAAK